MRPSALFQHCELGLLGISAANRPLTATLAFIGGGFFNKNFCWIAFQRNSPE